MYAFLDLFFFANKHSVRIPDCRMINVSRCYSFLFLCLDKSILFVHTNRHKSLAVFSTLPPINDFMTCINIILKASVSESIITI